MPQRRTNPEPPPPTMTMSKALPVLAVCGVFDALRFMFEMFWFFGPALAALYCTVKVGDTAVVGGLLAKACVAGAAVVGVFGIEVTAPIGVIMAMVTGLAGWLIVGLWLIMTNVRIFKENVLPFAASLLVSEVPFVGSVPIMTVIVWRMYRTQINREKAALKKYEEEQAAAQFRERRQEEEAYRMQMRAAQQTQVEQQEAANEEEYDAEEIPEEVREAA